MWRVSIGRRVFLLLVLLSSDSAPSVRAEYEPVIHHRHPITSSYASSRFEENRDLFDVRLIRTSNVGLQLSESLRVQKIDLRLFRTATLSPFVSLLRIGDTLVGIDGNTNLTITNIQRMIQAATPPIWLRFKAYDGRERKIKTIEDFEFNVTFVDLAVAPELELNKDNVVLATNIPGVEKGDALVSLNEKPVRGRSTYEINHIVRSLGKILACKLSYCGVIDDPNGEKLRQMRFRPRFLEYRPPIRIYRRIDSQDAIDGTDRRLKFYTSPNDHDGGALFAVPYEHAEFGRQALPCGIYRAATPSTPEACGALHVDAHSHREDGNRSMTTEANDEDANRGFVLFAMRGGCRYVDKVRNMQAASASVAVVINTYASVHAMPSGEENNDAYDVKIPAVMVGRYYQGDAHMREGSLWDMLSERDLYVSAC